MKNIFGNLYNKYVEFDLLEKFKSMSPKQRLIVGVIILVIFITLVQIMKTILYGTNVNFKKLNSEEIIANSYVSSNREIYWNLDNIIYTFMFTRSHSNNLGENRLTTEEFCNYTVVKEYKNAVGKRKINNLANSVIDSVTLNSDGNYSIPNQLIEKVYKYELIDNAYLAKLKTLDNSNHYIGIIIDNDVKRFYIFFLE